MKKQFRFDASQKAKVAQSLESLKNDTLSALSAELISGGLAAAEWAKNEWIKDSAPKDPVPIGPIWV